MPMKLMLEHVCQTETENTSCMEAFIINWSYCGRSGLL